ncbi:MAG: hypothetical protein ACFCBV_06635 [Phycisphaerales bacterium]
MPWDEYGYGPGFKDEPAHDTARDAASDAEGESLDPDRLCEGASSVYYAIARNQALREGRPPSLPMLLSPKHLPTCPHEYSVSELREAEKFLLRLGVIEPRQA